MKISSFLERRDLSLDIPAGDKRTVLKALADLVVSNHPEIDRESLLAILLSREELRSTGIEQGVAFPHGRIPGLLDLRSCFGICRQGVDFDSFDGNPTFFFFVLLIPEDAQGSHLKALSRLNRLFLEPEFRQRLRNSTSVEDAYDTILARDEVV